MIEIVVNGVARKIDVSEDTPLLWVLRDTLGLTGTKFACGIAVCGSCVVHVGGVARRSCVLPVRAVAGKSVTTIEGLSSDGEHPLQRAWVAEEVSQCGYCQPGMIMAAAALLAKRADPSDAEIDASITNLCRCGTYDRVRRAIHRAAKTSKAG
jgi:aerobic-type carbon monoxide dehydrogenase small subunit (CoxS/CutS family)